MISWKSIKVDEKAVLERTDRPRNIAEGQGDIG
jgi:hypothetical protein